MEHRSRRSAEAGSPPPAPEALDRARRRVLRYLSDPATARRPRADTEINAYCGDKHCRVAALRDLLEEMVARGELVATEGVKPLPFGGRYGESTSTHAAPFRGYSLPPAKSAPKGGAA